MDEAPEQSMTPPTRASSPASATAEYSNVNTHADAMDLTLELVDRQLDRAYEERSQPNVSIPGDNDVKRAFWLLFDGPSQRALFLRLCKRREFWPRIRSCVGSPPFSFLGPQDNDMLRAGGITAGRVNMSHDMSSCISSASDIGTGHFTDDSGRTLRVFATDNKAGYVPHIRAKNSSRVVFDLKLKKMTKAERLVIFKRSHGRDSAVTYPRSGERLTLKPNVLFGGLSLTVVVKTVEARGPNSPTCRLFCSVL
jgi:hypothetical protein